MNHRNVDILLEDFAARYPRFLLGIRESREVDPQRFDEIVDNLISWLVASRGEGVLTEVVDAFVQFSTDCALCQAQYEIDGHYPKKSFREVYASQYSQAKVMELYLLGVLLTNVLWAHHMEINLFFRDRFLSRLKSRSSLIELAPGHGMWGIWALTALPEATLSGFDISASAVALCRSLSKAAQCNLRASYEETNILDLPSSSDGSADGLISGFLLEHLEEPQKLLALVRQKLRPSGSAFLTAALTAAQCDHIFEFRYESELIKMCEEQGLRVLETLSAKPRRLLTGARFTPRSMALIVERREGLY